jgi:hypothetical protein
MSRLDMVREQLRPHLADLLMLSASLSREDFVRRCATLGWTVKDDPRDPVVDVRLSELLVLLGSFVEQPLPAPCGQVGLTAWEPSYPDGKVPETEADFLCASRASFDQAYQAVEGDIRAALGPPIRTGESTSFGRRLHHAIWQGPSGFLVLNQDDFDPQFGIQLLLWIVRGDEKGSLPTLPLPP